MPAFRNRVAFVVPTKDRPVDLRRLLASIDAQSVLPDQLIIVDGGDTTVEGVVGEFPRLHIEYVRHYPPSLSHQRNAGMARVRPEMALAGYLDDDLVFEPGALEAMLEFWETAPPEVGGARFNIIDEPHPSLVWLKALFGLDAPRRGAVLRSGFQTSISKTDRDLEVDWLSGGATVWRRGVVQEFRYDEWFLGFGYLEDVEYSYRVHSKYRFRVVAKAEVRHLYKPPRRDRLFHLGRWEAVNRMYFTRKNPQLSVLLCYWGLFGQIVLNFLRFLTLRNSDYLLRARGNFDGLVAVVQGRIDRTGGFIK